MKPVVVRGGGDLATGVIYRLRRAGFPVLVLETERPLAVRRAVSVCEAVYKGQCTIEGMSCRLIASLQELDPEQVNVIIDPEAASVARLKPDILIDAIMAKKNTGTRREMAPLTIALGPGFSASQDVNYVIETKRGHTLGRVIENGEPEPDTKKPGMVLGYGVERLLRAPAEGHFHAFRKIGDAVTVGETVGEINGIPVSAQLSGVLRGLISEKVDCRPGFKIGDIDPRGIREYCFTISEKALAVAGGVLEAILLNRGFQKTLS